jgi:hypothetical protein
MPMGIQRYIGGACGFAFAAVWVTAGLGAALLCAVAAGLGYGAVALGGRRQLAGLLSAKEAVRRELPKRRRQPRVASRSSVRPSQPRRRLPEPAPAAGPSPDTATYGW